VTLAQNEMTSDKERFNIYMAHKGILNAQHKKAYADLGYDTDTPGRVSVTNEADITKLESILIPEGFLLSNKNGNCELIYEGDLNEEDKAAALETFGEEGKQLQKLATLAVKNSKRAAVTREQIDNAQDWMCHNFYDVRMFGAVMSTGIKAGQVTGPLQVTDTLSVEPIKITDQTITRVAITREEDATRKSNEIGRRFLVPYALYTGHAFFSPGQAKKTGVKEQDLALFWEALVGMWDVSRSAGRGLMGPRGIYIFSHKSSLGNAPAHRLFDLIKVIGKGATEFTDYTVSAPPEGILEAYPHVSLKIL
jgi:CRISPR-associated protein Csd2